MFEYLSGGGEVPQGPDGVIRKYLQVVRYRYRQGRQAGLAKQQIIE